MADTPLLKTRTRPVFRNIGFVELANYRLPIPGIASIVHRISGIALFVCLLFLLAMLQMSLKSEAGFDAFRSYVAKVGRSRAIEIYVIVPPSMGLRHVS